MKYAAAVLIGLAVGALLFTGGDSKADGYDGEWRVQFDTKGQAAAMWNVETGAMYLSFKKHGYQHGGPFTWWGRASFTHAIGDSTHYPMR